MLRDLAQRSSIEAHIDRQVVGVGFARDVAGAALLVELLTLPDKKYEVVQRGNVVLLHRSAEHAALAAVSDCLRG